MFAILRIFSGHATHIAQMFEGLVMNVVQKQATNIEAKEVKHEQVCNYYLYVLVLSPFRHAR